MRDHVILCDTAAWVRNRRSASEGRHPLVVIETDPDRRDVAEANGLNVVNADATMDDTLLEAGLEHCRSLVAALSGDASTCA